jgi:hypothetical protein
MKVESEKDHETYRELHSTEFLSRPASNVSFTTNISMPVSYGNILTSHAASHANSDHVLSRPGSFLLLNNVPEQPDNDSYVDFPSVSRPPSYVYPGNNPLRFDPEPTRVDLKHENSNIPCISSNDRGLSR